MTTALDLLRALNLAALERLNSEVARRDLDEPPRCPVCGCMGRRDRPDLPALDCTCKLCGWHYTGVRAD